MEEGAFVVATGPGLGVEVDEDKLAEYRDGDVERIGLEQAVAMRFGFGHVPSGHYQRHVELVQRAERLGFDTAWIADQTFYRDPYVILAALATSTERIGLGLGATNPFTRHPAMTSRAIASSRRWRPAASRSRSAPAT